MKYSNEVYKIKDLFNVDCPDTCITRIVTDVTSLDRDHVPQVHDYWYSDKLKDVLNYLADPRSEALYISGSTGNGKTSLIVETAARLNWPCISINATKDMKPEDLIGCYRSGRDGEVFTEGPLLKAALRGYIFVLNVNGADNISADVVAVLKDAVEQQQIYTCNGQEIVHVSRLFRLVVTGSACEVEPGQGGCENGLLDICRICKIMQPTEKEFKSIIGRKFPDLFPAELQIISESLAAFQKIQGASHLVNIRLALKWAGLYRQNRNSDNPFHRTLERAVLYRMAEPDREVWYKALDKILVKKGIKKP